MPSKRAFDNWYFDYSEAEREFLEAKRSFEVKKRDVCLFLFNAYSEWCKQKFGHVVRPLCSVGDYVEEKPVDLFHRDFGTNPVFQAIATQMLNQAFDEKDKETHFE